MKREVEEPKNDVNRKSKSWIKYLVTIVVGATIMGATYLLPGTAFQAFIIGWLFLIPATVFVFLIFSLKGYREDQKNKIDITVTPNAAMLALARRYQALERERNSIYEEMIHQ